MNHIPPQTEVEMCESFSLFKKRLEENNIHTVKVRVSSGTMYYDTGESVVWLPVYKWVLTAFRIGKTEDKDRIYKYFIRFSAADQFPDGKDKNDFQNETSFKRTLRKLEKEGYTVRGGEWGRPLQERPEDYEID